MATHQDAVTELSSLFRLLPAMHDLDSIDKIYRLLLATSTCGETVGYDRAMLFVVDEKKAVIRGLYGVERRQPMQNLEKTSSDFRRLSQQVMTVFEQVDATDLTLKAKSFSVPIVWHRSAMVKASKSAYPVLAQRGLSEYLTDPFFDFFDSDCYMAVPIQIGDRTTAILAADRQSGRDAVLEGLPLLQSLAQQASSAAQRLLESFDHRRKSRILSKLLESLGDAESPDALDRGFKLALIMLSRAVGGSGCFLKDYSRQKTTHIKSVQDYLPEADEEDVAIAESFDGVLERCGGKMESIAGDERYPLLNEIAAKRIECFYAVPLSAGGDVAGALAVYTEKGAERTTRYSDEDRRFIDLCAGMIASHIDSYQKQRRVDRMEEFVTEISSNLTKERERSQLSDQTIEYHDGIREALEELQTQISSRAPHAKRMPRIAEIVSTLEEHVQSFDKSFKGKKARYTLVDIYDLVRGIGEKYESELAPKGVDVSIQIPTAGPKLLIDKKKIAIAIDNIIKTTVSMLLDKDRVLIRCSKSDDRVLICVADNGPGMAGDAITRLFMPFKTDEAGTDHKSLLSLAGEILQKHSGEIMIKSSRSWRTILILTLPIAANRDRRSTSRDRRHRSERRLPAESK